MAKRFDLIYVIEGDTRTMTCGIFDPEAPDDAQMVGPFPAKESAPKIVDALIQAGLFSNRMDAEAALAFAHMMNMNRGENDAEQSYPFTTPK